MEKITQWLASEEKDFDAGVALFNKHSNHKNLKKLFNRQNKFTEEKLEYELGKLAPKAEKQSTQKIENKEESGPLACSELDPRGIGPKKKLIAGLEASGSGSFSSSLPVDISKASTPKDPKIDKTTGTKQFATSQMPDVDLATLPDDLKSIYFQTIELSQKRSQLHDSLADIPQANKRKPVIEQMGECTATIMANYAVLDLYKTTGEVLAHKPIVVDADPFDNMSDLEKHKQLQNERASRSKASARIVEYEAKLEKAKNRADRKTWQKKIDQSKETLAKKRANIQRLTELLNGKPS